jgi:hypothetical protein
MNAQHKPKIFRLRLEMYNNYEVLLLVGQDTEEVERIVEKEMPGHIPTPQDWYEHHEAGAFYDLGPTTIMWQRTFASTDFASIGSLCHEASHTAFHICSKIGIYIGKHDHAKEAFVYLQEFIVKKFLEQVHAFEMKQH